jgi:hypothetical protein
LELRQSIPVEADRLLLVLDEPEQNLHLTITSAESLARLGRRMAD